MSTQRAQGMLLFSVLAVYSAWFQITRPYSTRLFLCTLGRAVLHKNTRTLCIMLRASLVPRLLLSLLLLGVFLYWKQCEGEDQTRLAQIQAKWKDEAKQDSNLPSLPHLPCSYNVCAPCRSFTMQVHKVIKEPVRYVDVLANLAV